MSARGVETVQSALNVPKLTSGSDIHLAVRRKGSASRGSLLGTLERTRPDLRRRRACRIQAGDSPA